MKKNKTKSILACVVLASVLGTGSVFAEGNAVSLMDFIVYGAKGTRFENPSADGTDAIAIGNFASADGASSNAIGNNAEADHEMSNAMGYFAIANAAYSNAIGANAAAQKAYSVALGAFSLADRDLSSREGVYELSVGGINISRVITHVADGTDDHDAATYGQVKGAVKGLSYDSNTKKISFTTVGNGTTQYLDLSGLGIGSPNYVAATQYNSPNDSAFAMEKQYDGGGGATALGYNSKANAAFATALGWGAQATRLGAIAIGSNSVATRDHALAAGDESKAEGENSTALGYKNEAKTDTSTAVGYFNVVSRTKGAAFGSNNNITGLTGIALGSMNEVSGDYAITLGSNSKAQEDYSVAMGSYAIANGVESMALGRDSQTGSSAVGAMAFGSSARAMGANALAAGSFSESAKRDYAVEYCKEIIKRVVTEPPEQGTSFEKTVRAITGDNFEEWLAKDTDTFISDLENEWGDLFSFENDVMPIVAGNAEGNMDGTTASGVNAISIGASTKPQGNMASGDNSIAIGTDARADVAGSVALGSWSVTSRTGLGEGIYELSVGGGTDTNGKPVYRVITNVADGTDDHDAATVGQVKAAIAEISGGTVDAYTKTETDTKLAEKANVADVYAKTDTYSKTEVNAELAKKADKTDVFNKAEVTSLIQEATGQAVVVDDKTAFGQNSSATGANATALGSGNTVSGERSTAVGYGNTVIGVGSGVFGDPSYIDGDSAYAIGNNNNISGDNSFVLGNGVTVTSENAVVLGNGSTDGGAYTVSVGASGAERRIVNVADGVNDHDAATYGQLKRTEGQLGSQINRLGNRVDKVGAGAAALAALHPMDFDPDNKLSFSAGVGNYRSENAAAVGMFWHPTDRVMFSMGATVGNDNNMVNAGVSFALDRKIKFSNGLEAPRLGRASRETLVNEVHLLAAENSKLSNQVREQNKKLVEQDKKLAAMRAEQDAKIARLMAMIEGMKKK